MVLAAFCFFFEVFVKGVNDFCEILRKTMKIA